MLILNYFFNNFKRFTVFNFYANDNCLNKYNIY